MRSTRASDGLIWPKDGCASIAYAAMAAASYFPPPLTPHPQAGGDPVIGFASRSKIAVCPPSSAALRLCKGSASSIASGRTIAIEAAMGATR